MTPNLPWNADQASLRVTQLQSRLQDDDPALRHVFTQTFDELAYEQALSVRERPEHPLRGALISVKDLFDVNGHVTRAGSLFMSEDAPVTQDAPPIAQLRDAGAVLLGHTTMTELAYSGLGLNPHYGTPENALLPGCIPGGSTSGGAISVAQGVADIAVGTDTGGSLRIPAAFNGIVGFKPTQDAISRDGCKALSQTLDSVGPMAASVETCKLAFQAMRDPSASRSVDTFVNTVPTLDPTFIVPENYGMDDLAPEVAAAFELAVARLRSAGFSIKSCALESLERLKTLAIWQFAAVEARAEYDEAFRTQLDQFDPRVASRIARADTVSATDYRLSINLRHRLIREYRKEMQGKVLLMPTVPMLPPLLSVFSDEDNYARLNLQALRNPSIANVMDCCSISLPIRHAGHTTGLMLTAAAHTDDALLDLAGQCEALLRD